MFREWIRRRAPAAVDGLTEQLAEGKDHSFPLVADLDAEEAEEDSILQRAIVAMYEAEHDLVFDPSGREKDISETAILVDDLIRDATAGGAPAVARIEAHAMEERIEVGDGPDFIFDFRTAELMRQPALAGLAIPSDLVGNRAANALRRRNVRTLGDLSSVRLADFMSYRGVGVGSLEALRRGVSQLVWNVTEADPGDRSIVPTSAPEAVSPYVFDADVRDVLTRHEWSAYPIAPSWMPRGGYLALAGAGLSTLGDIALMTEQDRRIKGVGTPTLLELQGAVLDFVSRSAASGPPVNATVRDWLDIELDTWNVVEPWLHRIPASDPWFGLRWWRGSIASILERQVMSTPRVVAHAWAIRDGIEAIHQRVVSPAHLLPELASLVRPRDRDGRAFCARHGWDGQGAKTLDEVGKEFDLTRERVRQITKKVGDRRLKYAPYPITLHLLLDIVDNAGGAMSLEDLGRAALAQGLVASPGDVFVLESVAILGFLDRTVVYDRQKGFVATSLAAIESIASPILAQRAELLATLKQQLRRRGIVSISDLLALADSHDGSTLQGVIDSLDGVAHLMGEFVWRPEDVDSPFHDRLRKLLVVLGPQPLYVIHRALRRESRRRPGYGAALSAEVLRTALDRSPYVSLEAGRYEWIGASRTVSVGVAEQAVADLLGRRGPAMHKSVIEIELASAGIEPVTLSLALGSSLLIDRVAPGVYAVAGAALLPADVELAREQAVRSPEVSVLSHQREGEQLEIVLEVHDLVRWNGWISLPPHVDLDGDWALKDGDIAWKVVVRGRNLRNGIKPWLRRQSWTNELVVLRFHPIEGAIEAWLTSRS